MTKVRQIPLPTRQEILDFIRESPGRVGKRELARAFNLTGERRVLLREILQELERGGDIERGHGRRFAKPGALPDTMVVEISGTDADGELMAKPLAWREAEKPPRIYLAPEQRGAQPLGVGDRVLVRLRRMRTDIYEARPIRRITAGPAKVLGVFRKGTDGARLTPTNRREKAEYQIAPADMGEASPGELVLAEVLPQTRGHGLRQARVVERLGDMADPRTISLVAVHAHGIPTEFPPEAVAQADAAGPTPAGARQDLRGVPLVTIDGEDARDFDDAVFAEPDTDPANAGGWHAIVAIADVAWYVRPGDPLDRSAYERGNSVYFPDRVVPMLPEGLSNGWCSLKPAEDRPAMAVHLWLDRHGNKLRHQFVRAIMRSAARLTYAQVQMARDGQPDEATAPLAETVIAPLYGAWAALFAARERRGVLDLDLPERKVVIGANGHIERVEPRARWDSHRLIEDLMIAANVAAAETLEGVRQPCMYRVHDTPAIERLDALREFLTTVGLSLPRGQHLEPRAFNQILEKAAGTPNAHLVNEVVLRAQAQAIYAPENIGHFGLALARYAHFTSPIRRYADLLVHRALITGLGLGDGGLEAEAAGRFSDAGEHISSTERRAAAAERDALDRFTAAFLADRVGTSFPGRISGVTRFGLFIALDETGADGLVPIGSLPEDYYIHDERAHCLVGRRRGLTYTLGQRVDALLVESNFLTGSLQFHLMGTGPATKATTTTPRPPARPRPPPRRRR